MCVSYYIALCGETRQMNIALYKWMRKKERKGCAACPALIASGTLGSFDTPCFEHLNWSGNSASNQRFACKTPMVHRTRALYGTHVHGRSAAVRIASRAHAIANINTPTWNITFSFKLTNIISSYKSSAGCSARIKDTEREWKKKRKREKEKEGGRE